MYQYQYIFTINIHVCLILLTFSFIPESGCVGLGPSPLLYPGAYNAVITSPFSSVRSRYKIFDKHTIVDMSCWKWDFSYLYCSEKSILTKQIRQYIFILQISVNYRIFPKLNKNIISVKLQFSFSLLSFHCMFYSNVVPPFDHFVYKMSNSPGFFEAIHIIVYAYPTHTIQCS